MQLHIDVYCQLQHFCTILSAASVSYVNFLSQLKKLFNNFSVPGCAYHVKIDWKWKWKCSNVQIGNGQIENVQIGNTQIGSWEMLRLVEWNGPSWPP